MRWTRPRFTVRQMMVAVAVVAVLMFVVEGLTVGRRQRAYRQRAAASLARELGERDQERVNRELAWQSLQKVEEYGLRARNLDREWPNFGTDRQINKSLRQMYYMQAKLAASLGTSYLSRSRRAARRAAYHASMKRKYADAAVHPWRPVPPDPPPPP